MAERMVTVGEVAKNPKAFKVMNFSTGKWEQVRDVIGGSKSGSLVVRSAGTQTEYRNSTAKVRVS